MRGTPCAARRHIRLQRCAAQVSPISEGGGQAQVTSDALVFLSTIAESTDWRKRARGAIAQIHIPRAQFSRKCVRISARRMDTLELDATLNEHMRWQPRKVAAVIREAAAASRAREGRRRRPGTTSAPQQAETNEDGRRRIARATDRSLSGEQAREKERIIFRGVTAKSALLECERVRNGRASHRKKGIKKGKLGIQ